MEVLAVTASIIPVIQIIEEIVKLCGTYIRNVRHAHQDIERLQSKVLALQEVLTRIKSNPQLKTEQAAVKQCLKEVTFIKDKIKPEKGHAAIKRMGIRAFKWPFTSKEVDEKIKVLEGYLVIFSTALQLNIVDKVSDAEQDRLLEKLAYVGDAPFNSYACDKRHRLCLDDTRVDVLRQIMDWANGMSPQCIFWLKGMAGTGKSTIAFTVASRLQELSKHSASYFFKRGVGDLAHARMLITTVVRQLSRCSCSYQQLVLAAVKEDPGLGQWASLHEQYEKLVLEPLCKLRASPLTYDPFLIVLDALDECDEQNDLRILLRLLAKTKDTPNVRVRIFVTSRPELPIRLGFGEMPSILYQDLALHNVPRPVVDGDIEIFLRHELENIQHDFRLSASWPEDAKVSVLVEKAAGLFIFAATACRYIDESPCADPQERIEQICNSVARNELMTEELDQMYTIVLQNSIKGRYTKEERQRIAFRFRYVVGSIVLLFSPLPILELYRLLHDSHLQSQRELEDTLRPLHSVLDVPEEIHNSIQPLHLSFRDFLLDPHRCVDRHFWIDEQRTHQKLARDCICLLSSSLRRNICGLPSLGTLNAEVAHEDVDDALSPSVQYACRYWASHAQKGEMEGLDHSRIHDFLQQHFLHWLEAMSLMGKVSEAIISITNIVALKNLHTFPLLHDFICDCRRFVLAYTQVITNAPEQIYAILIFTPLDSKVRQYFRDSIPQWTEIHPQITEKWSPRLQTLECPESVTDVKFSFDGQLLMTSGLTRSTIELWDTKTGEQYSHLKDYTYTDTKESLSPDGQLVASGSTEGMLRLWDTQKGEYRFNLEGHSSSITTLGFSPNSSFIASGSQDGSIRLSDTQVGHRRWQLKGHSSEIITMTFSPDCKLIASTSFETLRIWDAQTGQLRSTLENESFSTKAIAFSPDSYLLASGLSSGVVRLFDIQMDHFTFILEGHSAGVDIVRFSPDSQQLASGSSDGTVRLWNIQTGICRSILKGLNMDFSPNSQLVALGSFSGLVRLWDIEKEDYHSILDGHANSVSALAFSPDGRLLASGSYDSTVRLWDMQMGEYRRRLEDEECFDRVDRIVFSPDGRLVASESSNRVQLWNVETGKSCFVLEGRSVAFSPDCLLVASASSGGIVRLLDLKNGECRSFQKGLSPVFSPEGQLMASVVQSHSIQLWKIQTGDSCFTLEGHSARINLLIFSPKGQLLASGSGDSTIRLWSVHTGKCNHVLETYSPHYLDILVFAPSTQLLASGSEVNGSVRLWDAHTGHCRFKLKGYAGGIRTVIFSPDSQLMASGSFHCTVQLWDTETGEHVLTIPYLSHEPMIGFHPEINLIFVDGRGHEIRSTKMTEAEIAKIGSLVPDLQVDASREWITKSSERVLWLTPERRPSAYAVCGDTMVIGSGNGYVTFLLFGRQSQLPHRVK